jgi:signal transduction histidine kinase
LIGLHVSQLNAPTDKSPEETAATIIRSLTETGQWSGEVRNRRKDGTLFWCGASVAVFDHPEHGPVWVTVQEDISQRKAAELELARYRDGLEVLVAERTEQLALAKEQAEAANHAKTNFLNSISHELRTPLHLILGMTSLAVESATDPGQRRQIEKAHKSGRHLLAIINDILDIAKIDAGSFAIEPSVFSLQAMLDDALGLIEPLATEKHLALSCTIDPAVPDRLLGDGLRIKQILINYLANAVKFSDRGGIRVAAVAAQDRDGAIWLRLQVSDDGCGIAPALQERLFHDFSQVDSSSSRKYGGAGLGLSICRRITELMGGRVGLDSEVGVGSTFWAEIPLRRAD